ncbi:VOC family protein [Pseudovibrio sp. Alg231-02]|uniref:VOC family protein n=1 Tax=Pseudovibrio sp. Alg231-02 TaxID=1922223 RepID=UPI000D556E31|nr:VOC family protein [Pseudovibrio sp. Alg231-02]
MSFNSLQNTITIMRRLAMAFVASLAFTSIVSAEPFQEVTIGVPVPSLEEAEVWYAKFLGPDTEVIRPVPGIVEFKVAPGVWLQVFEADDAQSTGTIVRFLVDDMATSQQARSEVNIHTGEAIEIPEVVTYSEFADPSGNALGFYDLP